MAVKPVRHQNVCVKIYDAMSMVLSTASSAVTESASE